MTEIPWADLLSALTQIVNALEEIAANLPSDFDGQVSIDGFIL